MNWEYIVSLLSGGAGVFLLKLYTDWRAEKRGDKKDVVGAWQQIADREAGRYERVEARVNMLEQVVYEQEKYVKKLEHIIIDTGLKLPDKG